MDLSTRIAPLYREKEMEIRNMISKSLERGKVDFSLWIEKDVSDTATPINAALVENYYNQIKSISEMTHIPMPEDWFATLLRMPDVLTKADVQELSEDEWEVVRRVVEEAINHLVDFRKQEGTALEKKFNEKIDNIERLLKSIEPYETERVAKIRERITDALEKTISVDYDKNRLEQELIYYIEKLDINEEKQRLSNHLRYFRETMAGGHGQGKTWFHSTGNGTRNQYDWQQIQSCRNAKHRSADEGRTGTNQRTGVKCNVTGSHTGHHSHKQRIKIWQQENLSFFQPLGFRQINHYQLSVDTKPEPVFLYFCHQPPSSRKRTAWCGIFLPIS